MRIPGLSEYRPIGDYAIIGDCRSAALISRTGSLDWLCLPRFDSASMFAALLDKDNGGRFQVRPTRRFDSERRYIPDTAILETTFRTAGGVLRLLDLMPVASETEKTKFLQPDHEILRSLECIEGEVEVEVVCDPRPDYARVRPRLTRRGALGLFYEHRGHLFALRSDMPLRMPEGCDVPTWRAVLRSGERRHLSLVYTVGEPAVLPPLGADAESRIERSIRWWRGWVDRCRYEGPHRDSVVRSALTLKLLTYAPSGAVIAAPTTSLPERVGGVRNWDYRFCWLRDASLTLEALFDLGYSKEGRAFLAWLLHTTRLTRPELHVVYDVFGEKRLEEKQLDHLDGYMRSRPVRVGNAAEKQLQLDVYGEVISAVYEFVARAGHLDRPTQKLLLDLGRTVCRRWGEPDEGIWEIRSERRHHTHSKVMCWVALDRLIQMHDAGLFQAPVAHFRAERDAIRAEVDARGYNASLASYVSTLGGDQLDASLLLLGRYGYLAPDSDRMRSTLQRIDDCLGENGVLYRYRGDDGLPVGEGAFGICSFWGVELLARQGAVAAATARFERLLSYANDLGLFGEQMDPKTGAALGNFPQAFTHVGLIDAALTLCEAKDGCGTARGRARQPLARGASV